MDRSRASLDEIRTLYYDERWPVRRIARHFGVTPQAIYERMRREGFEFRSRKGIGAKEIPKELLEQMHVNEKLTVAEIARRIGHSDTTVTRALDRHGIPRRKVRPRSETPGLKRLKIGERLILKTAGDPPFSVYIEAKRLNIRVVTRRLDPTTFAAIRTPLLTAENVRRLLDEGLDTRSVARTFLADYRTINKLIR